LAVTVRQIAAGCKRADSGRRRKKNAKNAKKARPQAGFAAGTRSGREVGKIFAMPRDRLVEETLMLRSLRHRAETLPRFSAAALPSGGQLTQILLTVGTLSSFGWLLLQNRIHPIVVFLLEIYLTF
jgi:hypothetical protein